MLIPACSFPNKQEFLHPERLISEISKLKIGQADGSAPVIIEDSTASRHQRSTRRPMRPPHRVPHAPEKVSPVLLPEQGRGSPHHWLQRLSFLSVPLTQRNPP